MLCDFRLCPNISAFLHTVSIYLLVHPSALYPVTDRERHERHYFIELKSSRRFSFMVTEKDGYLPRLGTFCATWLAPTYQRGHWVAQ